MRSVGGGKFKIDYAQLTKALENLNKGGVKKEKPADGKVSIKYKKQKEKTKTKDEDEEKKKALNLREWASNVPVIIVGCTESSRSPSWHLVDFGIAFEHLVLAATNFGLGTCWIGRLEHGTIREVLNIPNEITIVAVTPLGYPAETPKPKVRKMLSELVHYESF